MLDRTGWFLSSCAHLGPRRLDLASIGPFTLPTGNLLATPVVLQHAGRNGRRHTLACAPARGNGEPVPVSEVTVVPTSLQGVLQVPPSLRHTCVQAVVYQLDPDVLSELAMLHDAELLVAPWRASQDEEAYYGRPFLPSDSTPVLSGLLYKVARDMLDYARARPARSHMRRAGLECLDVHHAWAAGHASWPAIQAADPHRLILTWQAQCGYAQLEGSAKQVRAAEELRYDLVTSSAPGADEVAKRETRAGVWFGLARESGNLLDAWFAMQQRERERLHVELERERALAQRLSRSYWR